MSNHSKKLLYFLFKFLLWNSKKKLLKEAIMQRITKLIAKGSSKWDPLEQIPLLCFQDHLAILADSCWANFISFLSVELTNSFLICIFYVISSSAENGRWHSGMNDSESRTFPSSKMGNCVTIPGLATEPKCGNPDNMGCTSTETSVQKNSATLQCQSSDRCFKPQRTSFQEPGRILTFFQVFAQNVFYFFFYYFI